MGARTRPWHRLSFHLLMQLTIFIVIAVAFLFRDEIGLTKEHLRAVVITSIGILVALSYVYIRHTKRRSTNTED